MRTAVIQQFSNYFLLFDFCVSSTNFIFYYELRKRLPYSRSIQLERAFIASSQNNTLHRHLRHRQAEFC